MSFAMKKVLKAENLHDPEKQYLFLVFMSVLLRIWATVGELILTGVAHLLDRSRPAASSDELPASEQHSEVPQRA